MSLFGNKSGNERRRGVTVGSSEAVERHPNTPIAAFGDGQGEFAEIYGSSKVASARFFILSLVAMGLALVAVGALLMLMPLKEVRPWVVEVNTTSGVVNRPVEVQKITPNVAVVKAELARWVEAVYTIDALRTPELYKYANSRSRDKAIGQFTEFRVRERTFERMQKEPGLVREVRVTSVDASQSGIAFVFLTTVERMGKEVSTAEKTKNYRLTLHYQIDPAKSEIELLSNPLGIYVAFFNEAEERAN